MDLSFCSDLIENGWRSQTPDPQLLHTQILGSPSPEPDFVPDEDDDPMEAEENFPENGGIGVESLDGKDYVTSDVAMELFPEMTAMEKEEAKQCGELYYIGEFGMKEQEVPKNSKLRGKFRSFLVEPGDQVKFRYEILRSVGKGVSSTVHKAFDHKAKEIVALKIVKNRKRWKTMARKEIQILNKLNSSKCYGVHNIVALKDSFVFRQHEFLVMEMASADLFTYCNEKHWAISFDDIRRASRALFNGLAVLYYERVIHADIKHENILIDHGDFSRLKLIDFGTSSMVGQVDYNMDYVQSRFYRAPEVLLGLKYDQAIDTWSAGCVIAELFMGKPLLEGEDEFDQIAAVVEVRGKFPDEMLAECKKRNWKLFDSNFIEKRRHPKVDYEYRYCYSEQHPKRNRPHGLPLDKVFAQGGNGRPEPHPVEAEKEFFLDFVKSCLNLNNKKRWPPKDALKHRFLK